MALDRGTLAKIDRSILSELDHGQGVQLVKVPLSDAVSEKGRVAIEGNPRFLPEVTGWANPEDTILVMCRSGGRAALAVNVLAEAGYQNVYNILEGMEGERVNDPRSVYHRKRMVNGWKNAGLPWTYDLEPSQMRLPKRP